VLMDLHMPGCDGVAATALIRERHPATRVVVLTTYADDTSVLAALRAGALGYLTKESGREEIARALQAAASGQAVLDSEVQQTVLQATTAPAPRPGGLPDGLTGREGEVLALIAAGRSNQEIAGELFVSEATVKTHINNLFAKAALRDRAQAVRYAYRHGIVSDA
jgi:DNA-binding NarL/FixJ family response regulator